MSVRHRLTKERDRDGLDTFPRLVIEAEGVDDVYRLARHMEIGQVEFSEIGVAILRGMDRRWPGIVRRLVERMGPSRWGYKGRKPRISQGTGEEA